MYAKTHQTTAYSFISVVNSWQFTVVIEYIDLLLLKFDTVDSIFILSTIIFK